MSVLLGSRVAVPDKGGIHQLEFDVVAGHVELNLGMKASEVEVCLDGLLQSIGAYELVDDRKVVFDEPLPDCTVMVHVRADAE